MRSRLSRHFLLLYSGGGVAAPGAPTVSSAATSTSNIRTTITNISPTATTLKIYRSTDNVSFSLIDTVAVTGTSQNYDDGTITAGTNYYTKAEAVNSAGSAMSTSSKANTLMWGWRDLHVWKMEETSGTRADSVGSTNLNANGTGTLGAATGIIGNGAQMDSANSRYLSAADSAAISVGANGMEMCYWAKVSDSFASARELVSKRNDYISQMDSAGVNAAVWVSGVIKGVVKTATLVSGTWYFVSFSFDPGTRLVGIDLNNSGTRVTLDTGGTAVDDGSNPLAFGARVGFTPTNCVMDEIFFGIGRVLTTTERTALYNGGAGKNDFLP